MAPHSSTLAWKISRTEEPGALHGVVKSIPGSGRSLGGGHGNPLQYSCLENSMERGTWWATDHGTAESDTTE